MLMMTTRLCRSSSRVNNQRSSRVLKACQIASNPRRNCSINPKRTLPCFVCGARENLKAAVIMCDCVFLITKALFSPPGRVIKEKGKRPQSLAGDEFSTTKKLSPHNCALPQLGACEITYINPRGTFAWILTRCYPLFECLFPVCILTRTRREGTHANGVVLSCLLQEVNERKMATFPVATRVVLPQTCAQNTNLRYANGYV